MKAWAEILSGIALAVAAEPIHESGHAIATRILTGVWPEIGFWAVHPASGFATKLDALIVLAAGDLAVLAWWGAIFLLVCRRPRWRWALVGPSLMTAIVLVTWFASAVFAPLGRADLGASNAAKFLAVSGMSPWMLATVLGMIIGTAAVLVSRYFRLPGSPTL
ncbi:MAG: hypothetical protein JO022_18790 [Acidobacteriaceae bacterium]|nr:hypothetical protein [Acidobacteriaceae bacterium]